MLALLCAFQFVSVHPGKGSEKKFKLFTQKRIGFVELGAVVPLGISSVYTLAASVGSLVAIRNPLKAIPIASIGLITSFGLFAGSCFLANRAIVDIDSGRWEEENEEYLKRFQQEISK